MAKLLPANDARQLTDLAKKKIAQERRLARLDKEEQKKYRQLLQDGWDKQMVTMIAAAVKGSKSVSLKHPIYYFKILLELDFKVCEVGWVKNQEVVKQNNAPNKNELQVRETWLTTLEDGIQELFDSFIEESQSDMSKYYEDSIDYQSKMQDALNESFLEKDPVFDGDHTMWVDVPDRLRNKYSSHFSHISKAIKYYRRASADPSYRIPQKPTVALPEFILGEYEFSQEDKPEDILVPEEKSGKSGAKANFFKVKWSIKSKVAVDFLQEPLFSCQGLVWLSTEYGQQLVESIFSTLQNVSEKGASKAILIFEKNKEGWHFINHRMQRIPSCLPEDISQILSLANYEISDTKTYPAKFSIHVVW